MRNVTCHDVTKREVYNISECVCVDVWILISTVRICKAILTSSNDILRNKQYSYCKWNEKINSLHKCEKLM